MTGTDPSAGRRRPRRRLAAAAATSALVCGALVAAAPPAGATYQAGLGYDPATATGSLYAIQLMTGAHAAYKAGWTGKGVDVALIDTGVAPVPGLTSGNVVNGPDLSFDGQEPPCRPTTASATAPTWPRSSSAATRRRPRRRRTSTRPASSGWPPTPGSSTSRSARPTAASTSRQVLAAINWVVEHRNTDGLNIRVLNLRYGTDSVQPVPARPALVRGRARLEGRHRRRGRRRQRRQQQRLPRRSRRRTRSCSRSAPRTRWAPSAPRTTPSRRGPARAAPRRCRATSTWSPPACTCSGCGRPTAASTSTTRARARARRFIRGNGTSQAAAVVSGAAALYLQKYPTATPDQVKKGLINQSVSLHRRGAGLPGRRASSTSATRSGCRCRRRRRRWAGPRARAPARSRLSRGTVARRRLRRRHHGDPDRPARRDATCSGAPSTRRLGGRDGHRHHLVRRALDGPPAHR